MFKRLRRFSLYINLKKCELFIIEVEFLSFVVFIEDVIIDKRRIEAI